MSNVSQSAQKKFFIAVGLYFTLQVILRTLISGTVDLDESEQLILTQKFQWGYGSQPPLYTWLQMIFFNLFGVSVFSLALLKNLLLFAIYSFTFLNVRWVTKSEFLGFLGAVSLLFIPQVSWESQRDLTHSVLATAVVTLSLFVFLRLRESSWRDYATFGICAGLGFLSKYNYAVFLFGIVLSALTMKRFRGLILNPRILLSVAICLLMLIPHLLWAFENRAALTTTIYKFHQQENGGLLRTFATGLARLIVAIVFHIGPLLAVFAVLFRKQIFRKTAFDKSDDYARLIWKNYLFIFTTLVFQILLLRVTGFKDRWFEPILISIPILLFALAKEWIRPPQIKVILAMGIVVATCVLAVVPFRIIFVEKLGRTQLLNAPYRQLKSQLEPAFSSDALIVAENKWVGGNLRLLFPNHNVVTPELAKLYSPSNRDCVLVWDATRHLESGVIFNRFVKEFCGNNLHEQTPQVLETLYQFHRTKTFRLGVAKLLLSRSRQSDERAPKYN